MYEHYGLDGYQDRQKGTFHSKMHKHNSALNLLQTLNPSMILQENDTKNTINSIPSQNTKFEQSLLSNETRLEKSPLEYCNLTYLDSLISSRPRLRLPKINEQSTKSLLGEEFSHHRSKEFTLNQLPIPTSLDTMTPLHGFKCSVLRPQADRLYNLHRLEQIQRVQESHEQPDSESRMTGQLLRQANKIAVVLERNKNLQRMHHVSQRVLADVNSQNQRIAQILQQSVI